MKRTRNLKCKDKRPYDSHGVARAAMVKFFDSKFGGVISPNAGVYPCNGHYHWGHSRDRKS